MRTSTLLLSLLLLCCLCNSFTARKITWTAIGDSITYLNDHADETGNRVTKGYMTRVTERVKDLEFINQGHNGWTAVGIAREIDKLGLVKSDVYSIFLGTNDWWQGLPLGTIDDYLSNKGISTSFGAFRVIIDKIRSLNADAQIILITPMQRADFVYINDPHNNAWGSYRMQHGQELSRFAVAVKEIGAREHLTVVDLYNNKDLQLPALVKFKRLKDPASGQYRDYKYPDYIGVPFNPDADAYPYPVDAIDKTYDGLHPSDAGYAVIAGQLVNFFAGFKKSR